jgi:ribosomal 50S subunit-associated protein YjgA (DUF615 family)
MRLIIESSANRRRENLLTSNEVIAIILDKYTDASRRDLVLIIREASRERPQIRTVNVTHATYMPLHYILLFLYSDPS